MLLSHGKLALVHAACGVRGSQAVVHCRDVHYAVRFLELFVVMVRVYESLREESLCGRWSCSHAGKLVRRPEAAPLARS